MGVIIDPVTSGPLVNDMLETNISGVFACGNVLHVHDLVDYVSKEAVLAGRNAARYAENSELRSDQSKESIHLKPQNGIRYTVPQSIDPVRMEEFVTVRFRVGNVYRDKQIGVYYGDKKLYSSRKKILTPGEMEEVKIKKQDLMNFCPDRKEIVIAIEDV
jgi:pyruvate/2-oxoglutarate dehydrogenase complex dihydrolipoamide dehydrogenase (E3) component